MKQRSIAELQQMARDNFSRDVSEADAEAYRGRLPGMVRTVATLSQWEKRLRDIEPATVHSTPAPESDEDGAD